MGSLEMVILLVGGREMYQALSFIFSFFDPRLAPFIFVLNIIGYWLKKTGLPKWAPPLPLLLVMLSFLISAVFGWVVTEAEGTKAIVLSILYYGIGNGLLIGFLSTSGYDIVHSFLKNANKKKEVKE